MATASIIASLIVGCGWTDLIISFGGGVIGDYSAFVASILKRGINFINIPTTLLAQVDSAVGGKTGVNSTYGKNLIGSFYQPKLVVSDTTFINSLSISTNSKEKLLNLKPSIYIGKAIEIAKSLY